jgi:hypothetical protein
MTDGMLKEWAYKQSYFPPMLVFFTNIALAGQMS